MHVVCSPVEMGVLSYASLLPLFSLHFVQCSSMLYACKLEALIFPYLTSFEWLIHWGVLMILDGAAKQESLNDNILLYLSTLQV